MRNSNSEAQNLHGTEINLGGARVATTEQGAKALLMGKTELSRVTAKPRESGGDRKGKAKPRQQIEVGGSRPEDETK